MKLLITGANGLLGQKLVLLSQKDRNIDLIATGRGPNRNPGGNYSYEEMDILYERSITTVFERYQPDVIINTAAMTQVDQCESDREHCRDLNVNAVQRLVDTCKRHNSFLIHLSTDFVFDGTSGPYREDDEPNPLSYYAKSKLESEDLIVNSTIDWAIVRTILVYGVAHDMSRTNIILWVKKNLEEGKRINVVNDQWRMPTLAENLAEGCLLIAGKRAEGVFHISGKTLLTPYEIALETARFFDLDASLITEVDGSVFKQPAKRPARTGFVLDKAIDTLGYIPLTFSEGLKIMAGQLK